MPPTPKAVRVRTSEGWQDIALVGPPGPAGPVGPSGYYAEFNLTNPTNIEVSVPGSWAVFPLNNVPAFARILEPSGAFTLNADHSVTVRDAGWYHISASAGSIRAAAADHQYFIAVSTVATPQDGNIGNANASGNYARCTAAGDIYLAAGQKVWMHHVANGTLIGPNARLFSFSIHRIGAGPQGPAGPTGIDAELFKPRFHAGSPSLGESATFISSAEQTMGAAADMRHTITPSRRCWWEVYYKTILVVLDAAWLRVDGWVSLDLSPNTTDLLALTNGAHSCLMAHNALGWQTIHYSHIFLLEAGKTYTARGILQAQGGTWKYYHHMGYAGSWSKVVGYYP